MSTRIIPIRDLKDTSKISELCHEQDGPVFITKNGYQDMVIMSTDTYDKMLSTGKYTINSCDELKVAEPEADYSVAASEIYSIEDIKNILFPILEKFKVKKAVLFGSYAKGIATYKSDIDLYVTSGLKGLKFYGLLDAVANSFSCPVDLIDSQDVVKGSKVDREIERTGVTIYG